MSRTSNSAVPAANAAVSVQLAARLQSLKPLSLSLSDKSASHRGHPEAHHGAHFHLEITCAQFAGMPLLQRHRLVYDAAGNLPELGIHALSMKTTAPATTSSQEKLS